MGDPPRKKLSRQWLFQIGVALIVLPFLGHVIHYWLIFQKAMGAGDDKQASEAAIQQGVAKAWSISSWTCPLMMVGMILAICATVAHIRRLEQR